MKKTKVQLEKELAKVQQKLADAIIKLEKNTTDNAPIPCVDAFKDIAKPGVSLFEEITTDLNRELMAQLDGLDVAIAKISCFDGGCGFGQKTEDKVYNPGVCGSLQRLAELAKENRNRIDIINSRLNYIVG